MYEPNFVLVGYTGPVHRIKPSPSESYYMRQAMFTAWYYMAGARVIARRILNRNSD